MLGRYEIPILPLASVEDLSTTVMSYLSALGTRPVTRHPQAAMSRLLSFCTIRPPLSEHATNVLSDVASSFRDLVDKATTEEGRRVLQTLLEKEDADAAASFWLQEYCS
jgi:hypothetical protein